MLKKVFLVLLIVVVVIQFFRPAKNQSAGAQPHNIENKYAVSADVKGILQKACYDCHSNHTNYPWYSHIQPTAWWLNDHIQKGKKELNFDEFTNKPIRYQYHKIEEVEELIREDEMPLKSFTLIHRDAILTPEEKNTIYTWVANTRASIEAAYPMDSLVKR